MNFKDLITFGQKIRVNLDRNNTEPTQKAVVEFLAARGVTVEFPKDWSWEWTLGPNPSGYSGNLPKRISKLHYQQNKKRIAVAVQSDLGEMFQRLVKPVANEVVIDFDDQLEWKNGDFGDRTSCFAQDKNHTAFKVFVANGGFALRQWDNDGHKGIGRALCKEHEGILTVFNAFTPNGGDGYGHSDALPFAKILAAHFQTDFLVCHSLYAYEKGSSWYSSSFYSNGRGYLIGPLDLSRSLARDGIYLGIK